MSHFMYILFKHPSDESGDNLELDWNVHVPLFKRSKKAVKILYKYF